MRRLVLLAAVSVAVLAACSSPQPRFYTLSPMAPAPAAGQARAANVSVMVGPVSIRPMFDQPQIVVTTGRNQVTFDEFNRWATPLPDDISRVVAQDLMATLGTPHVALFKQSANTDVDYRVSIDIQGFDSELGEAASLNAAWVVRRTRDGKSSAGRTSAREVPADKGFDALAAAHSRALAKLSQDIGTAISDLQKP